MKSRTGNTSKQNPFLDLTRDEIERWAGPTTFNHGKSCQRSGAVHNLVLTKDNALVAWVNGSSRYVTRVTFDEGEPASLCTCACCFNCKHGVAVFLEYLESVKLHKNVHRISNSDERIRIMEMGAEDEDNNQENGTTTAISESLAKVLHKRPKTELVALLLKIAQNHVSIRNELLSQLDVPAPSRAMTSKTVSREIDRASQEPGWQDHWHHEGYTPDYTRVRTGLQQLFKAGHYDEVIHLGKKLFRKGLQQIGQSQDEGETMEEIQETLAIVYKALPKCSLDVADKMELVVEWELLDNYGLAEGLHLFWNKKFNKNEWGVLADRLLSRLKTQPAAGKESEFQPAYRRRKLTDQIARALAAAGRHDELLQLYIQEAPLTHSYEHLVELLIRSGKTVEAEKWIRTGFQATYERWPGIAAALRRQLYTIHTDRRNWPFCAAIKADEFFEQPALSTYTEIKKFGVRANVWSKLQPLLLAFLHSGVVPDVHGSEWPLPDTGMRANLRKTLLYPPLINVLLEIALHEKNLEEALRLYTQWQQPQQGAQSITNNMENYYGAKVANAVKQRYPDHAIAIWKRLADNHIASANVKEYGAAVRYLEKMLQVMINNDREHEARFYIAALRAKHSRKIRLMEKLDALTEKRIKDI